MADISKIQLPSGNVYDIKDATAREMISGGVSFIIAWDGTSTPVVANIPAGVVVKYNSTNYTGTLSTSAAQAGAFYLVKSQTQAGTVLDAYDEYVVAGEGGSKVWEKIGDTQIDLSDVVTGVTLNKSTDKALGESTTFTNGTSTVTFSGGSTDTFVKTISPDKTKKLVTTSVPNVTGNSDVTIPNVTSAGSASSWSFAMGTGEGNTETLVISGSNSTAPTLGTALSASKVTLGTAITAATGSVDANGTGAVVVTDVTAGSTASAVTGIGTGTAAAQTITVGTNDKVTVLTDSTSISVTKGS